MLSRAFSSNIAKVIQRDRRLAVASGGLNEGEEQEV